MEDTLSRVNTIALGSQQVVVHPLYISRVSCEYDEHDVSSSSCFHCLELELPHTTTTGRAAPASNKLISVSLLCLYANSWMFGESQE